MPSDDCPAAFSCAVRAFSRRRGGAFGGSFVGLLGRFFVSAGSGPGELFERKELRQDGYWMRGQGSFVPEGRRVRWLFCAGEVVFSVALSWRCSGGFSGGWHPVRCVFRYRSGWTSVLHLQRESPRRIFPTGRFEEGPGPGGNALSGTCPRLIRVRSGWRLHRSGSWTKA